jgi:hypothetical protein
MTSPDLAFADPELTEYIIGESSLARWWAAKQVSHIITSRRTMAYMFAEEASEAAPQPKDHHHAGDVIH